MRRSTIARLDALGLRSRPRLRLFLKHAYCLLIDPFGRGRRLSLDIGVSLHMPTYFATEAWTDYEVRGMRACHDWLASHPDAVLADVGCSIAIYSLMALQVSPSVRVFAFDSDSNSLKASAEFCRFCDLSRLGLVHGFLPDRHKSGSTLAQALANSRAAISAPGVHAEPTLVRYLCLDRSIPNEAIPRHSLDGLLLAEISPETPFLIKIDVEGAELVVLSGASRLLLTHRPTLLLSVHPQFLPSFEHTPDDVAKFLGDHGSRWTLLNAHHEEHWGWEPVKAGVRIQ